MDEDGFEVPSALQTTSDRNIIQDLAINVFNFFKKKQTAIEEMQYMSWRKKWKIKYSHSRAFFCWTMR